MSCYDEAPLDLSVNQPAVCTCSLECTTETTHPDAIMEFNDTVAPLHRKRNSLEDDDTTHLSGYGVSPKKQRSSHFEQRQFMTYLDQCKAYEDYNDNILADMELFLLETEIFTKEVQSKLDKNDLERALVLHNPVSKAKQSEERKHIQFYSKWFKNHGVKEHCVYITDCLFSYASVSTGKVASSDMIHMLVAASSTTGLVLHKIQYGELCKSDYVNFLSAVGAKISNKKTYFIMENWLRTSIQYSVLKEQNIDIMFLPLNQSHLSMLTPMKSFVNTRVEEMFKNAKLPTSEDSRRVNVPLNTLHNVMACRYLDESLNLVSSAAFASWFQQVVNRFDCDALSSS
ncbi:uncharacterized protein [Antedon mediterranea]|uniref:uncharacterized protein n=1 Tax=Antedon mediterranea TaxID=105859 RepID=UPI003AF730B0